MKVFISWSGAKSKAVASALNDWLPTVLQSVEPWFSPEDIAKGAAWFSKIQEGLTDCKAGIICLTAENKDTAWILFESGAIARGVGGGAVATLLIDLTVPDVVGPLAQFNHTLPDRASILKLVGSLNALTLQPLSSIRLNKIFDGLWVNLQKELAEAEKLSTAVITRRTSEDMVAETLDIARQLNVRMAALEDADKKQRFIRMMTPAVTPGGPERSFLSHHVDAARRGVLSIPPGLQSAIEKALGSAEPAIYEPEDDPADQPNARSIHPE